jgi:hypothetical protein
MHINNNHYDSGKEVKYFSVASIKVSRERIGMAPLILNLNTRWKGVVYFPFRPLYLPERPPGPIKWGGGMLNGPHSTYGKFWRRKISVALSGIRNHDRAARES